MNADSIQTPTEDYFQGPVCTDATADLAYGTFIRQGSAAGNDFGHWRDALAWSATYQSQECTVANLA